jgi:hypothetical protein
MKEMQRIDQQEIAFPIRASHPGEMVYIDRFGPFCTGDSDCELLVFSDEGCSSPTQMNFVPAGMYHSYVRMIKRYLITYGKPRSFSVYPGLLDKKRIKRLSWSLRKLGIRIVRSDKALNELRTTLLKRDLLVPFFGQLRKDGVFSLEEGLPDLFEARTRLRQFFVSLDGYKAIDAGSAYRSLAFKDNLHVLFYRPKGARQFGKRKSNAGDA